MKDIRLIYKILKKDEVLIIRLDEWVDEEKAKIIWKKIDTFWNKNKIKNKIIMFSGDLKLSTKKWWEFWK